MYNSKRFFVNILGLKDVTETTNFDIAVQRYNERNPFCYIKTNKSGKVFLRVNSWDDEENSVKYIL